MADPGWPQETPEYLLGGYYRVLEELRDLPRMIEFASDVVRHDRMLDVTGGDAAAMSEARAALDVIAAQDDPDLAAALALACHRDQLADRNASIPAALPTVWVALGQPLRAQALAYSIADAHQHSEDLAAAAHALAAAGQGQQAHAIAQSMHDGPEQAEALGEVAEALAAFARTQVAAGHGQEALEAARSILDPYDQTKVLAEIAQLLAAAGQHEQAETAARQAQAAAQFVDSEWLGEGAQIFVALSLAAVGHGQEALATARSIEDPIRLADIAQALVGAGQHEQAETAARRAVRRAEYAARSMTYGNTTPEVVVRTLAAAGQHERALAAVTSIPYTLQAGGGPSGHRAVAGSKRRWAAGAGNSPVNRQPLDAHGRSG